MVSGYGCVGFVYMWEWGNEVVNVFVYKNIYWRIGKTNL